MLKGICSMFMGYPPYPFTLPITMPVVKYFCMKLSSFLFYRNSMRAERKTSGAQSHLYRLLIVHFIDNVRHRPAVCRTPLFHQGIKVCNV